MSHLVVLIPIAIEWILLTNSFSPLLAGKFRKSPTLGIAIWLSLFTSVIGLAVAALAIATFGIFELRDSLGKNHYSLPASIVLAFGPWLLLVLAGGVLTITNARIEPIVSQRFRFREAQILPAKPFNKFHGVDVEVIGLPMAFALAVSQPRPRILVSELAIETLSEAELEAVLWHELGHLRLRHNQLKGFLGIVSSLTRFAKATRVMHAEVLSLTEIAADSFAAKHVDLDVLVSARAKLA